MPPRSGAVRKRVSLASPDVQRKTENSAPRTRRSRPLREWRTSGIVDKQSTLTQIDFVRPASRFVDEDLNLDYEEEGHDTIQVDQEPKRKRRKLEQSEASDESHGPKPMLADTMVTVSNNKENEPLGICKNDNTIFSPALCTPRKPRHREVLSSQSPATPLSIRSTKKRLDRKDVSPLKDLSVNIFRRPRLLAEDTYKTNDTESTLSRTTSVLSVNRQSDLSSHIIHDTGGEDTELHHKSEISDSDEELSDAEIVEPSDNQELPTHLNDFTMPQSDSVQNPDTNTAYTESEAEIHKPPVSDDSKNGEQDPICAEEPLDINRINQEADTLDDALLLRYGRTYSGIRRRSIAEEVPSSSALEELSNADQQSQQSSASGEQIFQVPSSPPIIRMVREPYHSSSPGNPRSIGQGNDSQHGLDPDQTIHVPSSPPTITKNRQSRLNQSKSSETDVGLNSDLLSIPSDSQQATVQLQQECRRPSQAGLHSSQATTASIPSSPAVEDTTAKQSALNRRGWFFNPLTDSQLLPDSIMNFELPRFPRLLSMRRATDGADVEEDEQL